MKILVINGANLNMLGVREPEIYGRETLGDINAYIKEYADKRGVQTEFFQSNHEGDIIDKIHSAHKNFDGAIINPGAYTHYSYAIADAISSVSVPFVEVHISNIYKRESFRHTSVIAPSCLGQISGLGKKGYICALDTLIDKTGDEKK